MLSKEEIIQQAKRWQCVYPAYIDAELSLEEGRKVPKGLAVSKPTLMEISGALSSLSLFHLVEQDKAYPRCSINRGRFKVNLFKPESKTPVNPDVKSRKQLLRTLCLLIKKNRPP